MLMKPVIRSLQKLRWRPSSRWTPPTSGGLAISAYDARSTRHNADPEKPEPQSPAVDKGSNDAWGYDSTSTDPEVIDMSQPDIGYHYYRRIADDDPPQQAGQKIEISFQQPSMPDYVDTANLNYVIAIPGGLEPDVIEHFSYNEHRGKAVIDELIVKDDVLKLVDDNTRYDLEAYSKIGTVFENPPDGTEKFEFMVIVDSFPPELE